MNPKRTGTAVAIVATVRRHGGEFVIVNGRFVLRKASCVPANVVERIRAHSSSILTIVRAAGVEQPTLPIPSPPPRHTGPVSFLDREDARFDELLAEFGISAARPNRVRRRSA